MFNKTESNLTIDHAVIDHYVAKARRERSQAFIAFIKSLFAKPVAVPVKAKGTACAA